MKKEQIKQIGHQGDTQWFNLTAIPENAVKTHKQFIAASERSGSFHGLFGNYDMYTVLDGFIIDAKDECVLNHSLAVNLANFPLDRAIELPKKDHRKSNIPKGIYFVGIQNRFDPMGNVKKRVID